MLMNFGEDLKKVLLAGVGAVAVTAEKSKEMVDTFVEKGELTIEQGKILNEELRRTVKNFGKDTEVKKETVEEINKEEASNDLIAKLDKLSKEELEVLKSKLAELEGEKVTSEEE